MVFREGFIYWQQKTRKINLIDFLVFFFRRTVLSFEPSFFMIILQKIHSQMHIPEKLRIRSRGTERHSA